MSLNAQGKNTEKYITFSVPIFEEVANDDEQSGCDSNEEEVNSKEKKNITYKIQFIDSYRFMSRKVSGLVDNSSGIYDKECEKCIKENNIMQKCKFIGYRNNSLHYRCKECNKPYTKLPNEAIKHFPIFYQFCNGDLEKLFLLLGKGIYPYEYMDSWEKFDETSIPPKEAFYSELNEEGISDADYEHFQKVWEVFKIKTMGEYHGL